MTSPVAPLAALGSLTRRLSTQAIGAGTSLAVIGRSGLLGPFAPWRLARVPSVLVRYGVRLGGVYALAAALHGDEAAISDEAGEFSFGRMEELTSDLAAALAGRGVRAGDEVAVLCRNHHRFVATVVALGKIGADIVYLNTGFAAPQLAEVVEREGARALVLDEEFLEVAATLDPAVPRYVAWGTPGTGAVPGTTVVTYDELLAGDRGPALPRPPRESRQTILTSGTTGTPKGAQRDFSGGQLDSFVAMLSRIPLRTGDTTVVAAPMFHSWGLANTAFGLVLGAHLVMARRFDPEDTLRLVERHRATVLVAVPVMIQRIMALPPEVLDRYDTSSLRVVTLSGSMLPGDLANRFMDRFGEVLYNLYGSTEIGWVSIAGPADLRAAPGTAGTVPLGATVRLLDDDGAQVGAGATGRIFVRSGLLFEGYTGGGSKEVLEGFMSTGDVGHLDDAGRLFIDGRDDDMIVSGGENVFPREVEDLLSDHPAVAEAAVIGVPDPDYGQRLEAFVVVRAGSRVDGDELRAHVRSHLAGYKVPRAVTFLPELPRNATGKVLKRELRTATD